MVVVLFTIIKFKRLLIISRLKLQIWDPLSQQLYGYFNEYAGLQ